MKPHVAILMCTYNGARYLSEQLASFGAQDHQNWSLWVSDDGSRDETLAILENFALTKKVQIFAGPKQGFCANFLSLISRDIKADFFATSDQDDIWKPNKLSRALVELQAKGASLYGGRTELADNDGKPIGFSPLFKKQPCFRNAIVQSIMGGNTMVFDQSLKDLVSDVGIVDVVSHDWWLYILATAMGLTVVYDEEPTLLYRQTGANLIGSNQGLRAKINRVSRLLKSEFRDWNSRHFRVLRELETSITEEANFVIDQIIDLREQRGLPAFRAVDRIGLYRQTKSGQLALKLAAALGKL